MTAPARLNLRARNVEPHPALSRMRDYESMFAGVLADMAEIAPSLRPGALFEQRKQIAAARECLLSAIAECESGQNAQAAIAEAQAAVSFAESMIAWATWEIAMAGVRGSR